MLESQFHGNKILLSHLIKYMEGKPTAPDRMSEESIYNSIKLLEPDVVIKINEELHPDLPIARRAVNSLRSALQPFCDVDGNGHR